MSLGTIQPQFAPVFGSCAGTLGPLQGFAADSAAGYGGGTLGPLTGVALAYNSGGINSTLGPLTGSIYGSGVDGKQYNTTSGVLGGLTGSSGADLLQPNFAVVTGFLGGIGGFAIALAGMSGVVQGTLGPLQGFSTNTSGAYGGGALGPVTGLIYSADAVAPGYALTTISGYNFIAFGHSDQVLGSDGLPEPYGLVATFGAGDGSASYGFAGYSGASLGTSLPTPALVASGTVTITGGVTATLPSPTFMASGTTTELGRLAATLHTRYNTSAYGGASAFGTLPLGFVCGEGALGAVAGTSTTLPRCTLVASGTAGVVGSAVCTLPALRGAASGVLVATFSGYTFRASGTAKVTVEYEAYSFTLLQSDQGVRTATTHYTNYPFDRIVRFGSTYYGVASDGLYALDGDDFNGTPIISTIVTAETDFGSQALKRAESLYLGGRVGADMNVSVVSEELGSNTYAYRPVAKDGARTHRVKFGKGIRARFMAYKLTNVKGEDFAIDDMTPEVAETKRNV